MQLIAEDLLFLFIRISNKRILISTRRLKIDWQLLLTKIQGFCPAALLKETEQALLIELFKVAEIVEIPHINFFNLRGQPIFSGLF